MPNNGDAAGLGQRIKALRKKLGISQAKLASIGGFDKAQVCNAENGVRGVSQTMITGMKRATGVNLNWLLNGEGDMFASPKFRVDSFIVSNTEAMPTVIKSQLDDATEVARKIMASLGALRGAERWRKVLDFVEEQRRSADLEEKAVVLKRVARASRKVGLSDMEDPALYAEEAAKVPLPG
ncbi:MAG: helix-turn-helix domain-containing protein [Synergistaceae bacterium]|jgi:transcriptional regulator with XRE-family HTH domain|nr:helix-turn-helix domain-containing protein [Synergistaceae bacterium]